MAPRGKPAGIEGFAEDLGRLLGTAQAKAHGWIEQRQTIAKQLQQIQHTASTLLSELSGSAPARGLRRGLRRAAVASASAAASAENIVTTRRKRKLSAKARKAISDAQKRRWAAVRAAKNAKK
jgi:hypothetical protein